MATTDIQRDAHLLILPLIYTELHGFVHPVIQSEIEKGTIQADRAYECYEAKKHGTKVSSVVGMDLANGDECKLRTTWLNPKTGRAQIVIAPKDTKNKSGDILLGVVNKETMMFDRFRLTRGEGYVPGKAVYISWSIKGKGYGKYQRFLISSQPLG